MGHPYYTCILAYRQGQQYILAIQRHSWLYPSDSLLQYTARLLTLLSSNRKVLDDILAASTSHIQHRLLETYIQLATFDPTTGNDLFSEGANDLYIDDRSYMTVIDISDPRTIRHGFIDEGWKVKDANDLADKWGLTDSLAKEVSKWATIQQDTINVLGETDVTQLSRLSPKNDDQDYEGPDLVQIIYCSHIQEGADDKGRKHQLQSQRNFVCSIPLKQKMTARHQIGMIETFFTFLSQRELQLEVGEVLMAAAKSYCLGDENDKESNTVRRALPDELCEIASDLYHSRGATKRPNLRCLRLGELTLVVTHEHDMALREKAGLKYAFVTRPNESRSFSPPGDWWHPCCSPTIMNGSQYLHGADTDTKYTLERVLNRLQVGVITRTDLTDIMEQLNQYARDTATAPPMCLALKSKQYQNLNEALQQEFSSELENMNPAQKARTIKAVQALQWLFKNGYGSFSVSSYAACVWLVAKNSLTDLADDLAIFDAAFTGEGYARLPCLLRLTGWERRLIHGSLKLKLQGLEHLPRGHQTASFSCFLQLADGLAEVVGPPELPTESLKACQNLCRIAVEVFCGGKTAEQGYEAIQRLKNVPLELVFGPRIVSDRRKQMPGVRRPYMRTWKDGKAITTTRMQRSQ